MSAKLTQEFVDAWLAENRPDFVPEPGWVYVSNKTPIPGSCRVCGADDCAPRLCNLKNLDRGHCNACGDRAMGEKQRARGEARLREEAKKRGYEVLSVFSKRVKKRSNASGFSDQTYATLRCDCGNAWDVAQYALCSHGEGCGNCAEFGYDSSKPGAIYLLARSVDGVEQRGFGISNDWPRRTAGYERFGWLAIDVVEFENGQEARDFEDVINREVAMVAGRSVEPDSVYYRNKEAFAEGHGVPMFRDVRSLISWAEASAGAREGAAA